LLQIERKRFRWPQQDRGDYTWNVEFPAGSRPHLPQIAAQEMWDIGPVAVRRVPRETCQACGPVQAIGAVGNP
jgi:hypothetical protein